MGSIPTPMLTLLNRCIFLSRWIAAVFIFGLLVALVLFALRFITKLWKFAGGIFDSGEERALLDLLHLLDWALVATMVVMMIVALWDSYVTRLPKNAAEGTLDWILLIDTSELKLKLAGSVVAISSIHLLQMSLQADDYSDRSIRWALWLHGLLLLGVLVAAVVLKLRVKSPPQGSAPGPDAHSTHRPPG